MFLLVSPLLKGKIQSVVIELPLSYYLQNENQKS